MHAHIAFSYVRWGHRLRAGHHCEWNKSRRTDHIPGSNSTGRTPILAEKGARKARKFSHTPLG
jgi:hypothetical protein